MKRRPASVWNVWDWGDRVKKGKKTGLRLWIRLGFAALSNGYLSGFATGKIYQGAAKTLCAPGMNCYSCPGALFSCPIGSLQSALSSHQYRAALYVLGMMTVFGAFLGRTVCGLLCPFGLLQDLFWKIPFFRKIKKLPGERFLRSLRFILLGLFVLILPAFSGGEPWFCKLICPVGTLEAGIPLVLLNRALRAVLGFLYAWKLAILAAILLLSLLIWRPFCRYLCPLGAFYGLFNRFALTRQTFDPGACISCGACRDACGLDIPVREKPNSVDCVRCGACRRACPTGALGTLLRDRREEKEEDPRV